MPTKKIVNVKKEKELKVPMENLSQNEEKISRVEEDKKISNEIIKDPNVSPIFDVAFYRELFMSLRQSLDNLYDKREKSEKDSTAYDDAVYNITTNALDDMGAQDFLSYCYKKGKYDFCLMNYEKYMKWSILAASRGNAFTLSKLQIYLTNAIEEVLDMENHDVMLDFLELTPENYYIFISKLICEEIVNKLQISAESLIKMPEVYQEQNEESLRLFDNAKIDASKAVKDTLKKAIDQLKQLVEQQDQQEKEEANQLKIKSEEQDNERNKEEAEPENKADTTETRSQAFKKAPTIKKFRY